MCVRARAYIHLYVRAHVSAMCVVYFLLYLFLSMRVWAREWARARALCVRVSYVYACYASVSPVLFHIADRLSIYLKFTFYKYPIVNRVVLLSSFLFSSLSFFFCYSVIRLCAFVRGCNANRVILYSLTCACIMRVCIMNVRVCVCVSCTNLIIAYRCFRVSVEFSPPDRYPPSVHSSEVCTVRFRVSRA